MDRFGKEKQIKLINAHYLLTYRLVAATKPAEYKTYKHKRR